MKRKGIIALLVLVIMIITVSICEDEIGMEHLEDSHTKCVVVHKKVKDKKKYHKG